MSQVTDAPATTSTDRVAAAVARARAAFDDGRTRPLSWRRGQLAAVERLLAEREGELVEALASDLGRPAVDAWLGDVASVAAEARYVDPDAVTIVQGGPEETQRLVGGDVDHVFFTGSPEIGAKVMETAAKNLTPVTLELGGKCPVIVDETADLGVAARCIAWTKLLNSGQTCIAPDYVLAHRAVLDDLVAELQTAFDEMGRRDGMPIVDTRHAGRIAGMLDGPGGRVVRGGSGDVEGSSVELTIVVDPDADSA